MENMGTLFSIMRRVAGGLLMLFAAIPFLYSTVNQCFLFSEYDFRYEVVDFSAYVPFTLSNVFTSVDWSLTSLLIMLWCLQFVLPAFLLGSQMVKRTWDHVNYWALGIMVIVAAVGMWMMIACALYQQALIEEINDCTKEAEVMPAIYSGAGLIGPFFDVFSFYMCVRLIISRQELQDSILEGWSAKVPFVVSLVLSVALSVNSLYWLWRYINL